MNISPVRFYLLFLSTILLTLCNSLPAYAQLNIEWSTQSGTADQDVIRSVSADSLGNVFVAGDIRNSSNFEGTISNYDSSGSLQWTRQIVSGSTRSTGVSSDSLGNAYVTGFTQGTLNGTNAGGLDAFLSKYDSAGTLQWTQQLGGTLNDTGDDVWADSLGSVFVAGTTQNSLDGTNAGSSDPYITKFDSGGSIQWTRQIGTTSLDRATSVTSDSQGNAYVSGHTFGSLGGPTAGSSDPFVSKFDPAGTLLWTRQFGSAGREGSEDVATDALGNVYITGETFGSLNGPNAGSSDTFVSKFDSAGVLQWTEQFGTSANEQSNGLAVDALGNVYITGSTDGDLAGINAGESDLSITKFDSTGSLLWTQQLGTSADEFSTGISLDSLGNIYIAGATEGSLGGVTAGDADEFLIKFSDPLGVPEPSSLCLLVAGGLLGFLRRRRV